MYDAAALFYARNVSSACLPGKKSPPFFSALI